jgi:quinolinate synthase
VVPDREASCSLVESCPVEPVREFRRLHPEYAIVSYINTSIQVKAESDILCTSRNAVQIVNSIPAEQPVLFLPDSNLGNYVKKQTGRENMKIWQGTCIVHATFPARRLAEKMAEYPRAKVVAHPECPESVLAMAEFIVMTESGVNHSLKKLAPRKRFYYVANENCNCSECPYMKLNTLEKLRDCLRNLEPRVELSADLMRRALVPLERMLAVK